MKTITSKFEAECEANALLSEARRLSNLSTPDALRLDPISIVNILPGLKCAYNYDSGEYAILDEHLKGEFTSRFEIMNNLRDELYRRRKAYNHRDAKKYAVTC